MKFVNNFFCSYCSNRKKVCRGDPLCSVDWKNRTCSDFLARWQDRDWSGLDLSSEHELAGDPRDCGRYVECVLNKMSAAPGYGGRQEVLMVSIVDKVCPDEQFFSLARKVCDRAQNVVAERQECRG